MAEFKSMKEFRAALNGLVQATSQFYRANPAPFRSRGGIEVIERDGPKLKFRYQADEYTLPVVVQITADLDSRQTPRFDVSFSLPRQRHAGEVFRRQTAEQLLDEAIRRREAQIAWVREAHDRRGRMTSTDWTAHAQESAIIDGLEQAAYVAQTWKPGLQTYYMLKNPRKNSVQVPWSRAYNNPRLANWTSDPTYSYEQFYRANPSKAVEKSIRTTSRTELSDYVPYAEREAARWKKSDPTLAEEWAWRHSVAAEELERRGAPKKRKAKRNGPKKSVRGFPKTSRSEAEGLYVFPKRKSFPIGDLYHAKMAVEWATTWPSLKQFHGEVLQAVEGAYPDYDWKAYSQQLARRQAAKEAGYKMTGKEREANPIVTCPQCGKITRDRMLFGSGCLYCAGQEDLDETIARRKLLENPFMPFQAPEQLPEAYELTPGIPTDVIASKQAQLPVIVKGPNGPLHEPSGKILIIGTVLRGSDIQEQVQQVFEEFLTKWEAMKNPRRARGNGLRMEWERANALERQKASHRKEYDDLYDRPRPLQPARPKKQWREPTVADLDEFVTRLAQVEARLASPEILGAKPGSPEAMEWSRLDRSRTSLRKLIMHLEQVKASMRKNPLSRPVYEEMPQNAGPYLPQMYPYGVGGRPASYTTEPAAKKNPRRKKAKKNPRRKK